ncbi:MAG: AAA family ATPase, partial [Rickettsiaceae bacterium]|nr:AAA family ATPase [Rickettsiaceae bacterium]
DDYKELLRVAASRKCNVILAGDERQLASVQRGGMYEVFSDRYGSSTILNIQRQKNAWGRGVAMAFSNGEVKSGIAILQANNKIIESSTKDASMQNLLSDWSKSNESLNDRLIIAVTNRDVNALNHGARQYLKLSGDLRGEEISVAGSHYMKGDRILIKDTNKGLGLVNGDFATVVHASKERFVISMEGARGGGNENGLTNDNKKLVEFNPSAYSGFKHGYATTVFKAQAASILEVFVFHDGFAGIRNSYVALSRNVRDLKLYINNQATKSVAHLVKQLGHDPEIGSSLSYLTGQDLANRMPSSGAEKEQGIFSSMLSNALDFTKNKITAFNDKHFVDNAYYKYEVPQLNKARVEDVLDMVASQMQVEAVGSEIALEERAVVGGNSINITASITNTNNLTNPYKVKQTAKERFYAKADYAQNSTSSLQRQAEWDMEAERLRSEVKYKTEAIARGLLGEPNKQLSDGKTLRFGEHGKIAVRISGERMGSWFDFSADKGGDMFALVQDKQGCDFKGAAEYLRQSVGIEASTNNHIKLVHDHRNKDLTEKYIKAKVEEERVANAKAEQAEKLYSRAREIGSRSVACRYLTEHRGLDLANSTSINVLSNDIKTTGVYVASEKGSSEKGKYLPVLVAFARDSEGNVTGGQQIFLDKTNANKADIAVPKKSFGKIAGAFVNVGNVISKGGQQQFEKNATNVISVQADKITIIAEGLETAMSVRQGLSEHNNEYRQMKTQILCSLGISNIKNYQPNLGEKIIIAADNDGVDSNTSKTIENAKLALEKNGAFVEVVR